MLRSRRLFCAALGAALAFASLLAPEAAQAAISREAAAELQSYLQEVTRQGRIPGMVALVTDRDGDVFIGAFGQQDAARGIPMREDSIFRIASMTKPVTSLAIMMLIEQNELALDDPAGKYLPQFVDKPVLDSVDPRTGKHTTRPAKGPVTIRHLLTHTSGLGYAFTSPELLQMAGDTQPGQSLAHLPLLHDPGTRWTYGESTRSLGWIVEKISGMPLDRYLNENIFQPLGMRDTAFVVPPEKHSRVVTVHRTTEKGLEESPNPEGGISAPANGDGGLFSTAADYARFIRLFLNGGRTDSGRQLISERSIRLMGEDHTAPVKVRLQPAVVPALSQAFPLGGVLLMQYLPFYDATAIETLQGFEQRVYRHVRRRQPES